VCVTHDVLVRSSIMAARLVMMSGAAWHVKALGARALSGAPALTILGIL